MRSVQIGVFALAMLAIVAILVFPPHVWTVESSSGSWGAHGEWIEKEHHTLRLEGMHRGFWTASAPLDTNRFYGDAYDVTFRRTVRSSEARDMLATDANNRTVSWTDEVSYSHAVREIAVVLLGMFVVIVLFRPRGTSVMDFYALLRRKGL